MTAYYYKMAAYYYMTAYYYKMNYGNMFCKFPFHIWQQFLVSVLILSREALLLCRLHLGVAQWNLQHVDGCRVDSIRGIPALQWLPSRAAHHICGPHLKVARWKQQHADDPIVDVRGSPAP